MRVLALGGCGGMGQHACRIAARFQGVELAIADLDGDRAERFARELGPGVTSVSLDVSDAAALASAIAGADVVMNTVGPFFRFGVPILTAAVEAGRHYLDICDDWEPTLEMLRLHDAAVRRGVTAVVGIGASPGITNLLAILAARELDSAREVITGWNIDAAQPEESTGARQSAAIVHGIRQTTGTIRVLRDGKLVDEAPLQRADIDYPGLGKVPAWTFGHPEPLMLSRTLEGLTSSVNVAHGGRGVVAFVKAIQWAVDGRVIDEAEAVRAATWLERRLPAPKSSRVFDPDRLPPLFGYARGERRGVASSVGVALCRLPGTSMGAATGTPLAVALELLVSGRSRRPGVFTPEALLEPSEFFATLARHCPGNPDPADMVCTTRSWDPRAREQLRNAAIDARHFIEQARQ